MNLRFIKGDIFKSEAEALINTVNCVGIMGKGIAKEVKKRYPNVFNKYKYACDSNLMKPGTILTVPTHELIGPKYIVNFPTKRHWKNNSRLDDIEIGLKSLVKEIEKFQFKSLAVPPLGCGNGGLYWGDVKPLIREALKGVKGTEITVFEPMDYIEASIKEADTAEIPKLTESRKAMLNLMLLYSEDNYAVSINEIHNLVYILQASGRDLNISFEKSNTGVLSKQLNVVLKKFDNHYFESYASRGKTSYVKFVDDLIKNTIKDNESINYNSNNLIELLKGFKNEAGIELFVKVLWGFMNTEKVDWETKYSYLHSESDYKEILDRINNTKVFKV